VKATPDVDRAPGRRRHVDAARRLARGRGARRRRRLRAALRRPGARVLWISGDTVVDDGVREVAGSVGVI
jgi:hypothetical protein